MWLVDKAGEPVAPAWLWLDARSAGIAEDFARSPDYPAHYGRTGTGVNACQMSMQLVWMTRHRPQVLDRAATSLHCKDWLYFKLTGDRRTDPSEANFTFGQYATRTYAPLILDALGASDAKRLLPEIVEGTEAAGRLTPDAAALTGLKSERRSRSAMSTCCAPASAAGSTIPSARPAAPSSAPPACT